MFCANVKLYCLAVGVFIPPKPHRYFPQLAKKGAQGSRWKWEERKFSIQDKRV